MARSLGTYIHTQASSYRSWILQELATGLLSWIPSLPGIAVRGLVYRTLLAADGLPAIERGVRLRYIENIRLGRNVYLDEDSYLHACPGGISIGDDTVVMHGTIMHVFNFRDLPHAGITIGKRCFIGERSVIRGQGGVTIGNDVLLAPHVQILAIDHVVATSRVPIMDQGIRGNGIVIDDGAWLGAGSIITDGVRVGRNAVVGAGAVVTRDVPDGCVAVGVPARVVREIDDVPPPDDLAPPITQIKRNGATRMAATRR